MQLLNRWMVGLDVGALAAQRKLKIRRSYNVVSRSCGGHLGELVVDLADLHGDDSLQEPSAVLRAGAVLELDHGIRELAGAAAVQALEVGLDLGHLLRHVVHVDLSVHLDYAHRAAIPIVVVLLDGGAWLAPCEGQLLLERDRRESPTLLLDELDLEVRKALV